MYVHICRKVHLKVHHFGVIEHDVQVTVMVR